MDNQQIRINKSEQGRNPPEIGRDKLRNIGSYQGNRSQDIDNQNNIFKAPFQDSPKSIFFYPCNLAKKKFKLYGK
jgi:hypothetical protein